MAEDFNKKLKDAQKKLKSLETAKYDRNKKGYSVVGFPSVLSVTKLEEEKTKLREETIPNLQKAINTQKESPGPTSRTGTKKFINEQVDIRVIDRKIKDLQNKPKSFDNSLAILDLLSQKKQIIESGYKEGNKTVDWSDKDKVLKEVTSTINSIASSAEDLAGEDIGTWRVIKSGRGAAATERYVVDYTPEEARIKEDRLSRLSSLTGVPTQQPTTQTQQAKATSAGDFRKAEGFAPGKPKKPSKPSKPGTGTGAGTVSIDGKKVKVGSEQWKTIIQQEFGSMWDVYNSNPDVKAIIDKSIKEGWYNDEIKLSTSLQNTGWYRTTQQSARQFAIQQSTDPATLESRITAQIEEIRTNALNQGVSFSDATLRKLATDSLKYNWSDQQKLNALGSEQVAQAQLGGPQGMADLRRSGTARNLRQKAASFFQKPSEDLIESWTQQILLGQKSEQQWDELMRSSARTQFRSLQPALDRGDDVETAMYAYKQQAQATLGSAIDTTQIDWTQDKWNKALNYRDEKSGEYRQMDLWEWNKYLRTLPEWQNTQEAKDAYRNVAYSLAQGFGKMA